MKHPECLVVSLTYFRFILKIGRLLLSLLPSKFGFFHVFVNSDNFLIFAINMSSKKNLSIETLRGIAILLVVIGHVIGSTPDGE